jgi:hypothetical protein
MRFEKAYRHLLNGDTVRRKGWYRNSRIRREGFTRFIILQSDIGSTRWQPYFDDFSANDWEVVGKKPHGRLVDQTNGPFGTLRRIICGSRQSHSS